MSKVAKRLLTFFIGLPLVIAIVFCDYLYHLPLQIIVGIFAVLGANEFYKMASTKTELFARELVLIGTALLPFACYTFILSGLYSQTFLKFPLHRRYLRYRHGPILS